MLEYYILESKNRNIGPFHLVGGDEAVTLASKAIGAYIAIATIVGLIRP